VLERGGRRVVVGEGGDITWPDVAALTLQLDRQRIHWETDIPTELPLEHLLRVLDVLAAFPGARIEDWNDARRNETQAPEAHRFHGHTRRGKRSRGAG